MRKKYIPGAQFGPLTVVNYISGKPAKVVFQYPCGCHHTVFQSTFSAMVAGTRDYCQCKSHKTEKPEPTKGYLYWYATCRRFVNSWQTSFDTFQAEAGPRPEGHRIVAKDPRKPIGPENFVWTAEKAGRPARVSLELRQEARKNGVSRALLSYRIKQGWSEKKACTTPARTSSVTTPQQP